MTDLNDLLERVREAKGPDRNLDAMIHHWALDGVGTGAYSNSPAYTASIDAALALVGRLLPPITTLTMKQHADGTYFHVEMETEEGDDITAYNHPSMPLAILAALLEKLTKAEAVAQALHDGFAPSNQIPPWRIAKDELKERSRLYAKDFERFLLEYGYEIVPAGRAALEASNE